MTEQVSAEPKAYFGCIRRSEVIYRPQSGDPPYRMNSTSESLEDLIRGSKRTLVVGVGGGGDVVGALATARMLEFCGIEFVLGGLSWERYVFDPLPGPRSIDEVEN